MSVPGPGGLPWDPRDQLPPGTDFPGPNGVLKAWDNFLYLCTHILPAAWSSLIHSANG